MCVFVNNFTCIPFLASPQVMLPAPTCQFQTYVRCISHSPWTLNVVLAPAIPSDNMWAASIAMLLAVFNNVMMFEGGDHSFLDFVNWLSCQPRALCEGMWDAWSSYYRALHGSGEDAFELAYQRSCQAMTRAVLAYLEDDVRGHTWGQ